MQTTADHTETRTPAEIVEAIYEAFGRKDVERALSLFDPEIEVSQSEELPWGGTHRGHEGALQFFGALMSHIDTQVQIDRLIVAGDTVVEVGTTCGRALATDRAFAIEEAHVWRIRDGRAVSMRAYVDNEAMLAAITP